MNFIQTYKDGVEGLNEGLPTGLSILDRSIDRVQRATIIAVAGAPKSGKSTLTDFAFLINPCLYAMANNVDVDFIYYSLEMSRTKLEYKAAAFFFYYDYQVTEFEYSEGTLNGSHIIPISPRYLLHKLRDDNDNVISVRPEHKELLKEIYQKRIIPIFGEYSTQGKKVKKGMVEVIEDRMGSNPTGIFAYMMAHAKANGTFEFEDYIADVDGVKTKRKRISNYVPINPRKYTIVIIDHLRKLKLERNYSIKQNVDKMLEYQVFLRNICRFTFVDIIHLNRNMSDIQRIKYVGENIYPNSSDIKDTGNVSEEADIILTLFNPHDDRYNLERHMGVDLSENPNYRSLHLIESRDTDCPAHMQLNSYFGISYFEPLNL